MSLEQALQERSGNKCELCSATNGLSVYDVPPSEGGDSDKSIYLCSKCNSEISKSEDFDVNHWRCLNDCMWSEFPVVQVMSFRMLKRLSSEGWAQDLVEQMYMDEETQKWAEFGLDQLNAEPTLDSNGVRLQNGDTVTIIKDLDVKGAGFTAKRGTIVRKISLTDNPKHIEGRVEGVKLVLVSAYMKKQN